MVKVTLRDYVAQEFFVRINGFELRMIWQFNTINWLWSLTVYVDDEHCPRIAGRSVVPSVDLFSGYDMADTGQEFWIVEKQYPVNDS